MPTLMLLVACGGTSDTGTTTGTTTGTGSSSTGTTAAWEAPKVLVNEFMASNRSTYADPQGDMDDWIELYNLEAEQVDLSGYHLTDDLEVPDKWTFPDGTVIEPAGFLLVWADNDEGDEGLHASFKLSADGESIGLFAPAEHGFTPLNALTYEPQVTDISMARVPDGNQATGAWVADSTPTPGRSNEDTLGETWLCAVHEDVLVCRAGTSWSDARQACEDMGGLLAVLPDPATAQQVAELAAPYADGGFWIGLSDIAREGTFTWVDGTPLAEGAPWAKGQPDNAGEADCVEMNPEGEVGAWADTPCDQVRPFVCTL